MSLPFIQLARFRGSGTQEAVTSGQHQGAMTGIQRSVEPGQEGRVERDNDDSIEYAAGIEQLAANCTDHLPETRPITGRLMNSRSLVWSREHAKVITVRDANPLGCGPKI